MSAVMFQSMPPLSPEEYAALEASIREHGIQVPILLDENGVVIDGHHRQKIAQELGVHCPRRILFDKSDAEKRTLALTLNLDRRHLNREQRRALIGESLKADPELSNVQHAKRTGTSDKTVATVREELESTSEIPRSATRISADGRERPATQPPAPAVERTVIAEVRHIDIADQSEPEYVDTNTGEILDEPAPRKVTGLDGKTYTPPPAQPKPIRPQLPGHYAGAIVELDKAINRLERLHADDRFNTNKKNVALTHESDIQRAIARLNHLKDELN